MIVGYARCSTREQDYSAQVERLTGAGAERIHAEKESGAKTDRPELARALASLQPGDVLTVTRLDRLARSTLDLHTILARVAAAGAGFRSIHEPMIDTTSPHGRLLLAMLAAMAEFERSLILSRTSEGRERARQRGTKFGPRPKLSPVQVAEARRRCGEGESPAHVGAVLGVSRQTIHRAVQGQP